MVVLVTSATRRLKPPTMAKAGGDEKTKARPLPRAISMLRKRTPSNSLLILPIAILPAKVGSIRPFATGLWKNIQPLLRAGLSGLLCEWVSDVDWMPVQ